MVEAGEPRESGADSLGHAVADVGQDAGVGARALQPACPLDHGRVEAGPEVDVGGEQRGELPGIERDAGVGGNRVPVSGAGEGSAVVVVAELPVSVVQAGFVQAGDGADSRPRRLVGRPGEHLAVVKQDRVNAACSGLLAGREVFCKWRGHLVRL